MKKVKLAVIGYGNLGSSHVSKIVKGACPDIEVVAICDIKPERIAKAKEKYGDTMTYFDDAETMLDSGLANAVLVATPHYDHPKYAIMSMKKGLHVMVEKPAGVDAKQVLEMNAVAKECNVVFAMMFNQRTNCIYRKMREIVQSGEMGALRRTNWIITDWYRPQAYYDSGDWRATWSGEGGGVLLNQCPHNLDLWQWICGMPKTVYAKMHFGKWHDIEVEDDVTAYVEYENGATGCFVTTTGDTPGTNRFEITMEKGKIVAEIENKEMSLKLWKCEEDMTEPEFSKTNTELFGHMHFTPVEVETDGLNEQHMGVFRAFSDAILYGKPLIAGGEEGINGLLLSNAMHLSAWTGKDVEIATMDHELFYEELMKRVKTSRRKVVAEVDAVDLDGTYGS